MGKINRGETTKLSVRLSREAKERIEKMGINLNLSRAGVMLFALAKIFEDFPSKSSVLNMESKYDLEPGNFPITLKRDLSDQVSAIHKEYEINKNILFGLVITDYFMNQVEPDLLEDHGDDKPVKILVNINEQLKKKMIDYSQKHYIPMSGLISYAIYKGSYPTFPTYNDNVQDSFFTTIPRYLYERMKEEAGRLHIKEVFYVELCLYRVFMSKDKVFI